MKGTTLRKQKRPLWRRNKEEKEVVEIIGGATQIRKIRCRNKYHLLLFHLFSPTINYKLIRDKMVNLGYRKRLGVAGRKRWLKFIVHNLHAIVHRSKLTVQ